MKRFCARCLLVWVHLFILVLGSGVMFAGSPKGKVKNHVYYSPADNFTVPVPPGTFQKWARVNDNFSSNGGPSGLPVGVVSFPDDAGELMGIQYTRMQDEAMPKLQAPDTREEALKTWLHGGAMPYWYLRVSPQSRIVHEAMATFEGMPVLLAVVVVPEASDLMDMTTHKPMDSRRGLVIFPRGQFVYLLSIEMTTAFSFGRGNSKSESDEDWQKFAGRLTGFYKSIVFQ